jgi:hypothetical protein
MENEFLSQLTLPEEVKDLLTKAPHKVLVRSAQDLMEIITQQTKGGWAEVAYEAGEFGNVTEAFVTRTKNGVAANYADPYMRRRDPDCMVIADSLPSDKTRFSDRFSFDFDDLRKKTLDWLGTQELLAVPFYAGLPGKGIASLALIPLNASFFAYGLGLLQGVTDIYQPQYAEGFVPDAYIFVAPPFRHTHFNGKQIVVHNRKPGCYEMFSYNLYPGPSAKKGIYGMLLNLGEQEEWVTLHCSTVKVITPYDNHVVITHEGASGGGKSEMLEPIHRENDGRILLGTNLVTKEKKHLVFPRGCDLMPVCDDMALCHPSIQEQNGQLRLIDAENAWFLRIDHIKHYGTDPHLEAVTIHPKEPLLFLNIDAKPEATALIWEHIEDAPGKRCPNPRVIVPRSALPSVVNEPVSVDIRSFGVRTPPCTKDQPSYGIIGLFHLLPPALAWMWRLVAPRGHANPSIVDDGGMSSEGVGSYWPFATGRRVDQANLLLRQFMECRRTRYVLCPNQNIGAYHIGFMSQWIMREYMARRGGAPFRGHMLVPARCNLLGYTLSGITIEGQSIDAMMFQVDKQPEVAKAGYDAGSAILREFFYEQLKEYNSSELLPLGQEILACFYSDGTLDDYLKILPPTEPLWVD